MRRSIFERELLPVWRNRLLTEITPDDLRTHCVSIVERGAPATAIHVRDILKQIYGFAILHGEKVVNPADQVGPASIATFVAKDRSLSPSEIRVMLKQLEHIATLPTIRLGMRLYLLTMVRKSELQHAVWDEVDFENAVWTIPKERMKRSKAHNVYLSRQVLDIMIALKTCAGNSRYLLPSRYDADAPMSRATFNRVTYAVVERAKAEGLPLEPFTVHDLRRTGSTLLNELGFNSDWIEKCLAHEDGRSSRGVYNKAEYEMQRRHMMQEWSEILDAWVDGRKYVPALIPPSMPIVAGDKGASLVQAVGLQSHSLLSSQRLELGNVSGRAGGEQKGSAEVLSVGQADLQSISHGRLRRFGYLGRFCDDREFTDEFAASAEVACDCNALELGPGLAERILGVCEKSGGTMQVEAAFSAFCDGQVL
jgi:integrase